MGKDEIRNLALDFLEENMPDIFNDIVIPDDFIEEYKYGWYIFYQSKKFIETGDINYSLVGNTPIFFSKNLDVKEFRRPSN